MPSYRPEAARPSRGTSSTHEETDGANDTNGEEHIECQTQLAPPNRKSVLRKNEDRTKSILVSKVSA